MHTCNLPDMTFLGTTAWEGCQVIVWNCPACEDQWVWDKYRGRVNLEKTGDPGGVPKGVPKFVDVIQECWDTVEAHGFHSGRTFGDACTLIHSEISEAYEAYRVDGAHDVHFIDGKPEGTVVELADAVIRLFDTALFDCGQTAQSFATIILEKMRYNRTRPWMHGKII